jgi:superoxide dismutase
MQHHIAPLFCRPWTLNGISPRLIESHYEHNYGEAINRLNAITKEFESLDPSTAPADVISRLKRDQFTELNSTLLHELYFASLGGDGRTLPDIVAGAIARDFGSVDRWRHEFVALATALSGSSGWVLLTYVPRDGRLINQTAYDHGQNIAGGIPILAIDMLSTPIRWSSEQTQRPMLRPSCAISSGMRYRHATTTLRMSNRPSHLNRSSLPICRPSAPKTSRPCWIRALRCRSSIRAQDIIPRKRKT